MSIKARVEKLEAQSEADLWPTILREMSDEELIRSESLLSQKTRSADEDAELAALLTAAQERVK